MTSLPRLHRCQDAITAILKLIPVGQTSKIAPWETWDEASPLALKPSHRGGGPWSQTGCTRCEHEGVHKIKHRGVQTTACSQQLCAATMQLDTFSWSINAFSCTNNVTIVCLCHFFCLCLLYVCICYMMYNVIWLYFFLLFNLCFVHYLWVKYQWCI